MIVTIQRGAERLLSFSQHLVGNYVLPLGRLPAVVRLLYIDSRLYRRLPVAGLGHLALGGCLGNLRLPLAAIKELDFRFGSKGPVGIATTRQVRVVGFDICEGAELGAESFVAGSH